MPLNLVGWLVEVTTLIISGINDSQEELDSIAGFIAEELGPDIPWHVSRFRPSYRMGDRKVTEIPSLERALECGNKHGLNYVYAGNVPGHESENTVCPACGSIVIERSGYATKVIGSEACHKCGYAISGIWN